MVDSGCRQSQHDARAGTARVHPSRLKDFVQPVREPLVDGRKEVAVDVHGDRYRAVTESFLDRSAKFDKEGGAGVP